MKEMEAIVEDRLPSEAEVKMAIKELLPVLKDTVLYELDRDANPNRFGFFFTKFEHPGESWWNMIVEDRAIWVHDDHQYLFTTYHKMFGFKFKNGGIEMMMCPNVSEEDRDSLKSNDRVRWASGSVLLSIPVPDTGYSTIRALPFDSFDIREAPNFDKRYINRMRLRLEAAAGVALANKNYDLLQETTEILKSDWLK